MSTSTAMRAMRSSQFFATSAACHEVPQAMIVTRSILPSANGNSGKWTVRVAGLTSALIVSPITAGCSKISLSMKWR